MDASVELLARLKQDQARDRERYGPEVELEMGHPELDTLDFQITCLVRALRLAKANNARLKMLKGTHGMRVVQDACARAMRALAKLDQDLVVELIAARRELKARGLHLGETERV
jgi:hypothetical protein